MESWKIIILDKDLSPIVVTRLDELIAVMQRVKAQGRAFGMDYWQDTPEDTDAQVYESDLHKCGSSACLGGWLGVSPEFRREGGYVDTKGSPHYKTMLRREDYSDAAAVSAFLVSDIKHGKTAYMLPGDMINLGVLLTNYGYESGYALYEDVTGKITIDDVLVKLDYLRCLVLARDMLAEWPCMRSPGWEYGD